MDYFRKVNPQLQLQLQLQFGWSKQLQSVRVSDGVMLFAALLDSSVFEYCSIRLSSEQWGRKSAS